MTKTTANTLAELHEALDTPRQPSAAQGPWRWTVRRRMASVRDALEREPDGDADGWLSARQAGRHANAPRCSLDSHALGPQVLEAADVEGVRAELKRLLTDIDHHVQRAHDLAYDEVELELGGSE